MGCCNNNLKIGMMHLEFREVAANNFKMDSSQYFPVNRVVARNILKMKALHEAPEQQGSYKKHLQDGWVATSTSKQRCGKKLQHIDELHYASTI